MASDLENATAETIRTSIQQAADQGHVRDIDLSCSGVDAGSIVQVGDVFFQHVHNDEDNVFDFTDWTLQHWGGLKDQADPRLKEWARCGAKGHWFCGTRGGQKLRV